MVRLIHTVLLSRALPLASIPFLYCALRSATVRLRSHIGQFREICKETVVGRKLDFLVQEFNREANTTCSKSNDVEITRAGLALKNEIEKIREQVQNLE